jgi:uncharacterized membrane protein
MFDDDKMMGEFLEENKRKNYQIALDAKAELVALAEELNKGRERYVGLIQTKRSIHFMQMSLSIQSMQKKRQDTKELVKFIA